MSFIKTCDGPDCGSETTRDRSAQDGWLTMTGADIVTLDFCTLQCATRYLAYSVAFADTWTLPIEPL